MAGRPAGASAAMTTNPHPEPLRVLVAGGGVAGMEAVLALRELAGERVDITLLAPERTFAYRPMAVAVPFARGHVQRLPLADFARETSAPARARRARQPSSGRARAAPPTARRSPYDALLVAVGAWSEPAVPGATTWTPELDQEVMGGLLADIEEGYAKRVAFVVPDGAGWPLPAYELALMTAWDAATWARTTSRSRSHARGGAAGDVRRAGVGVAARATSTRRA